MTKSVYPLATETTTIYCAHIYPETGKPCRNPLGILLPGEHGRQISTLEGTRVTSREDGGFFIHCPKCGHGYFWHLTYNVPVERVKEMLETARVMGWRFIKFSGATKRRLPDVLLR